MAVSNPLKGHLIGEGYPHLHSPLHFPNKISHKSSLPSFFWNKKNNNLIDIQLFHLNKQYLIRVIVIKEREILLPND